ncbi:uncharacterized protein LOC142579682 isoform X2 [Dermacentor variabilis]|uniref:uncharacterized protein LOC142579682 isoform X2 n=1 Tax=Dermacentor variabilis TaxID=34621 RepID=UPI003F5C4849
MPPREMQVTGHVEAANANALMTGDPTASKKTTSLIFNATFRQMDNQDIESQKDAGDIGGSSSHLSLRPLRAL